MRHYLVPLAGAGADVGDVTRPVEVRGWGMEVLQQQVVHHTAGCAAGLGAGPERFVGLGPQRVEAHQPSDAMQLDMAAGRTQFLMDTGGAVESPGAPRTPPRSQRRSQRCCSAPAPPAPPAAAARPSSHCGPDPVAGTARRWNADQQADQSGETFRRQLLFGKVRCRQAEKILLPPEFPVLLAEPVELIAFLAGQDAVVSGSSLAAVDTGLANPAGQAAGVQAKAWATALQERPSCMQRATASNFCCSVNRRLVLVG